MADIRYFNGSTRLSAPYGMPNKEFAERFPGVKGLRADGYSMLVGYPPVGGPVPVERKVEFKQFASKHECDARCLNATGKIMRCECSCGGANHGRGAFTRLVTTERVLEAA